MSNLQRVENVLVCSSVTFCSPRISFVTGNTCVTLVMYLFYLEPNRIDLESGDGVRIGKVSQGIVNLYCFSRFSKYNMPKNV